MDTIDPAMSAKSDVNFLFARESAAGKIIDAFEKDQLRKERERVHSVVLTAKKGERET